MTENATRWRGFSHEELYRMLHDGPGAPASATPSRRWAELTGALDEVGHQLQTALGALGVDWNGPAAGAAFERLSPLPTWAKATSESAAAMRLAVEAQGDHIARARADMPVPEGATPMSPDPMAPPAVQVVGAQTDAEPTEAARAAGEQRAVEVMTMYETNTRQNLAPLTPFEIPAAIGRQGGGRRGVGSGIRLGTGVSGFPGHSGDLHERGEHRPGQHRDVQPPTGTHSSAAQADLVRQRLLPGPGALAGAAPMEHFGAGPVALGAPREGDRVRGERRAAAGHAMGAAAPDAHGGREHTSGVGAGGSGGSAERSGMAAGAMQAAGAANAAAAGGVPPGGVVGGGDGPDKMGMRRLGGDAIGSAQWFADGPDGPAPRVVAGRNRDLDSTDDVVENVDVDGEDHSLPPPVIGG